jgi:hypothetical protein
MVHMNFLCLWCQFNSVKYNFYFNVGNGYLHVLPYHGNPLFRLYISLLFYLFFIYSGLNY